MERHTSNPPWLRVLNAMELEWRDTEIEKGRDPDGFLDEVLRRTERWPEKKAGSL
jgi:hypothetical protein